MEENNSPPTFQLARKYTGHYMNKKMPYLVKPNVYVAQQMISQGAP